MAPSLAFNQSNAPCAMLFLALLLLLWVVPYITAFAWMNRAQRQYFRLYQEQRHADVPFPAEMARSFFTRPQHAFTQVPRHLGWFWTILWEQQSDHEVERARRRVWRRLGVTLAIMIIAPALPLSLYLFTGC